MKREEVQELCKAKHHGYCKELVSSVYYVNFVVVWDPERRQMHKNAN